LFTAAAAVVVVAVIVGVVVMIIIRFVFHGSTRPIAISALFLTFVFNPWEPLLPGVLKNNNNTRFM